MTKYQRLGKNTVLFTGTTFIAKFVEFLMLPVYVRLLSPEVYGQLDVFQNTINLLVPLMSLQLMDAVFRFATEEVEEKPSVLANALSASGLMLLLSLVAYPILGNIGVLADHLPVLYGLLGTRLILLNTKQFLRGRGNAVLFALSNVFQALVLVCISLILMVVFRLGLYGYFLSLLVSESATLVFVLVRGQLFSRLFKVRLDFRKLGSMLRFSIPLVPNVMIWWLISASDRYLLAHYLGFEAVGLYAVAAKFPSLIILINGVGLQAWQMSAIEESTSTDRGIFYNRVFKAHASLMLVALGAVLLILRPLMSVLVSADYYESWRLVPLLLLGGVFSAWFGFFGVGYIVEKRTFGAFTSSLLGAFVKVGLGLALIPMWGMQAAAFSTMVSFLVMWIYRVIDTRHLFQIRVFDFRLFLSLGLILLQGTVLFMQVDAGNAALLGATLFCALLVIHSAQIGEIAKFGWDLVQTTIAKVSCEHLGSS